MDALDVQSLLAVVEAEQERTSRQIASLEAVVAALRRGRSRHRTRARRGAPDHDPLRALRLVTGVPVEDAAAALGSGLAAGAGESPVELPGPDPRLLAMWAARSAVPTLIVEAPADPINPPPHAAHLAASIPNSRLVTIPGMGHALHPDILDPLATAILAHTASVDADE